MHLPELSQDPCEEEFVQSPYGFYETARSKGPLFFWAEYGLPCLTGFADINAVLRDRRFGREQPASIQAPTPAHAQAFYDIEANSLLELEPPRHSTIRAKVLRTFTSRAIRETAPDIRKLCHELIDRFPGGAFDLLKAYAEPIPVITIARLLGVPEENAERLLDWSHAMVAMYQARRDRNIELAADRAAHEFRAFIIEQMRASRRGLLFDLVNAPDGSRLSEAEIVSTAILLLNAGHEATVHGIGNGVSAILASGLTTEASVCPSASLVNEVLRFDPPLHLFTRYAMEPVELHGHRFETGDQVAILLAAGNRDPAAFERPATFDPLRRPVPITSFGAGIHFCLGAPLAQLEMSIAFEVLFARRPDLELAQMPLYADRYHFHGLEELIVRSAA